MPSYSRTRIRFLGGMIAAVAVGLLFLGRGLSILDTWAAEDLKYDPTEELYKANAPLKIKPKDWPQWGGSHYRNNTPEGRNIPIQWNVKTGENIKWAAPLGWLTYGSPVVANGQVYVGTNNGGGYAARYPSRVDLGVLLCFDEETGKFLWQHSNEKLPTGRANDWPLDGIRSCPCVVGNRLWYVTNRGEVVCLDTEGFRDGENDGPFIEERPIAIPNKPIQPYVEELEADVVWKFDMLRELKVWQHNWAACSVTVYGDQLFIITANGVDEGHVALPQPFSPSFVCLNRHNGKLVWTDNSPGRNVLHGQWSSPAIGVFKDKAQVLFAGGDGWLYSFEPTGDGKGAAKLLWKFDTNPKEGVAVLGGKATRNPIVGTPIIFDGLVYVTVGDDPDHGEGPGHLWCIDPNRQGDVSSELVFNVNSPNIPIDPKRIIACERDKGDFTRPNPNSAAVWHYVGVDANQNNTLDFEETMHRTIGTVVAKNDLLFAVDFSGIVHCLDAKSGKLHWTHDTLETMWGSPLIVDGRVYCGRENGDLMIFKLSKDKEIVGKVSTNDSLYSTPIVANDVLFVANKSVLYAIKQGAKSQPLPRFNQVP